jgi:hypothetical protein
MLKPLLGGSVPETAVATTNIVASTASSDPQFVGRMNEAHHDQG